MSTSTEIDVVSQSLSRQALPVPPQHNSVELERIYRKERLAGALRIFGRFGFAEGVAGHITVRDPEFPDMFWVNPFGVSFRHVKVSNLILVNHKGDVVHGDYPVNRAAFAIHSAIHAQRPDVVSAAHAHSIHGKAFSTLHKPLRYLTQDDCAFYNDIELIKDNGGQVVFDTALGESFASSFTKKAAIHANHGLFTSGASVDEAAFWFVALERSCQAQLLALSAGDPVDIKDEWAAESYRLTGNSYAGWLSFQPLWQDIALSDPDLFT